MRIDKRISACKMNRKLILLCIFLIVLASIDCSRGGQPQSDKSTVTLLYYGGDERILSPYWDDSPKFLVFLPLVMENEKGELEGRLAESWEHSPDYRTWTIHLRKDVRWHDGVLVTAHDIKFTMDLYRNPELLLEAPDAYIVTLLDDFSLRIVFKKPVSNLSWWDVYYPKHLLEEAGWRDREEDGIRENGGQDFHFEAIIPSSAEFKEVAVYVQANLRKVGVRMEVQSIAQGVVVNRAMSGDFQAMFFKFNNAYLQRLRERQPPYGYKNPRFFQLWDVLNETGDPDGKDRIYRELMALFSKDLPITFLFPMVATHIAHRRIRGLSSPLWNGIILRMEHLWIEDEGK